jgi:hypothetical protein
MLSFSLALWLLLGPPEASSGAEDLAVKIDAVIESAEPAKIAELERAIAGFEAQPQVVLSDELLASELLRARVTLAWAMEGPERSAAIDEAIRSAGGREIPPGYGSDFKKLVTRRVDALTAAGFGTIEVDCAVPCKVAINEGVSTNPSGPLVLGLYRVWVFSVDGDVEPMNQDVLLETPGQTKLLVFEAPSEVNPADPAMTETLDDSTEEPRRKPFSPNAMSKRSPDTAKKQLLPMWGEIVGVVVGAGLIITGASLLAVDGRCKGGGDPRSCPTLIENTRQGNAFVTIGTGLFAAFGAVLVVDRVRIRQSKGVEAMLSWTFRF